MAFTTNNPRLFNKQNVLALNPDQNGVYGIYKSGVWIYVGKGDIRERLLAHLNGDNPSILSNNPTHWVDEVIAGDPSSREEELILELKPVCNKKIG